MARRAHDEYSNTSDASNRDLTAQFWGSSPSWRTTGTLRRTRRGGERTGPIARTRHHGDPTGQTPVVPVALIDEPHIDPYDFGFDDFGYGPDTAAGKRVDGRGARRVGSDVEQRPELIELETHNVDGPGDPISRLVDRLGLGAVDPLLLRLGVIIVIGVLLVPLAMSFRPDSSKGSLHTETTAAPWTELAASGGEPVVEGAPVVEEVAPTLGAGSGDDHMAPALQSAVAPAAAYTAAPAAVPTAKPDTSVIEGDITESPDSGGSDVAETVQTPEAPQVVATEPTEPADAADTVEAAEPAEQVAPACQLSYTVSAGDYWIRVADAAGITMAKLLQANLATVDTPLYPGDDICLPEGATLPSPPSTITPPSAGPPATTTTPTTTTPTTTVAPTTTAPIVTSPPAPGEVERIIREVWPDDLEDKALEIAWRESGYRPSAYNWCCHGLFQIHWSAHDSWLDDLGVTSPTQLLDARTNARAAYALYQRSGWGPWG